MMSDMKYCPVCRSAVAAFAPGGHSKRPGVKCPTCGANARTRLAWVFLERRTDFFDGRPKSMLHVAPEKTLAERFSRIPGLDYLSADIVPDKAMVQMDITDIAHPDGSFDIIYCSHVLEHVPDDRRGMRELARVLKPEGWALFMIPVKQQTTYEDFSITDPAERDRLFGHPEHVRCYGRDFIDRLRESGFSCEVVPAGETVTEEEANRLGLNPQSSNTMYFCRHPSGG